MEKRNIYKADDVLIIGSFLMLIPAVYMAWPLLASLPRITGGADFLEKARELLSLERLVMIFASLDAAVAAQVVGRILRHREKQSLDILDTVMYMGKTTVGQVAGNLSLPEQTVLSLTRRLARVPGLNIRLEGDFISREISLGSVPAGHSSPGDQSFHGESVPEGDREQPPISHELRDFIKNDRGDLSGKIEMLKKINASGGKITPEELKAHMSTFTPEKAKKMKGRMILLFFLFVTPLWPVALAATIYFVVKQYNSMKDQGLIQPNSGAEE